MLYFHHLYMFERETRHFNRSEDYMNGFYRKKELKAVFYKSLVFV